MGFAVEKRLKGLDSCHGYFGSACFQIHIRLPSPSAEVGQICWFVVVTEPRFVLLASVQIRTFLVAVTAAVVQTDCLVVLDHALVLFLLGFGSAEATS